MHLQEGRARHGYSGHLPTLALGRMFASAERYSWSSPDLVDRKLSSPSRHFWWMRLLLKLLLKLFGAEIAEGRVATLPVVPDGDPLEHGTPGLVPRFKGLSVDQLPFQ